MRGQLNKYCTKTMNASVNYQMVSGIDNSKNFDKRIQKVLPSDINSITIEEVGMSRAGGYGQYHNYIVFSLNDDADNIRYKRHHTSAPAWDAYHDLELGTVKCSNFQKQFIIDMLEYYFESL